MAALLLLAIAAYATYRLWQRRQVFRPAESLHQRQMKRWLEGRGPDPRRVMFADGIPADTGPEGPVYVNEWAYWERPLEPDPVQVDINP